MNRKIRFAGIATAVLAFAMSGAALARDKQCDAALAFSQMQFEAGIDIASYTPDEIQWLLAHKNRPAVCAAVPANLKARMTGEYPIAKESRRMNCHIAMDFLLDANEHGKPISDAEREWGAGYIEAVESGQACGEIPRALALRATGHRIVGRDMKQFLATAMDKASDSDAMLEIAMAYFYGTLVGKDAQKGYSYLQKASGIGNPWADMEIAGLYRAGKIEGEPKAKALDYALKASATDNGIAHLLVADLYFTGDVVKRDNAKAVEYYLKAAKRGELYATLIAADLLFKGEGVKKDRKQALELLRNASHTGDTNAMLLLAGMMLQQKDLVKNKGEVWYWIERSRDEGNARAVAFLAEKRGELEAAFVQAEYVPPKRECREILVCDVYSNRDGSQRSKICSTKRDWTTCDYSL